jgi:hypothetical protein
MIVVCNVTVPQGSDSALLHLVPLSLWTSSIILCLEIQNETQHLRMWRTASSIGPNSGG